MGHTKLSMRLLAQNKDWRKMITLKRKMVTTQVRPGNCKEGFLNREGVSLKEVWSANIGSSAEKPCSGNGSSQCRAHHCQKLSWGITTTAKARQSSLSVVCHEQPVGRMTVWGTVSRDMPCKCRYDPCCMGVAVEGSSIDALKTSHRRDVQLGRVVLVTDTLPSGMGVH